jgi:hypothetical protein
VPRRSCCAAAVKPCFDGFVLGEEQDLDLARKLEKEIIGRLGQLHREFGQFRQEFGVLGKHVVQAKNKYDDLDKLAGRLDDRLAMSLQEPEQTSLPAPATVDGSDETA